MAFLRNAGEALAVAPSLATGLGVSVCCTLSIDSLQMVDLDSLGDEAFEESWNLVGN